MKITFLGTSHGIAEKNHFCSSAVVTVGGKHYIIDAGAPITVLLQNHDMAFSDIAGIFITHSHDDHYMGLVELLCQMHGFPGRYGGVRFPIYVPDTAVYHAMFQFLFGAPEFFGNQEFSEYGDGLVFNDGTVKITAIPVSHIPHAHAFMVEAEGKRVFFTSDLKADMPDYPKEIFDLESDLVITEGAHTYLDKPEVLTILGASKTKRMLITHINYNRNKPDVLAAVREKLADRFPVQIAEDGLEIDL